MNFLKARNFLNMVKRYGPEIFLSEGGEIRDENSFRSGYLVRKFNDDGSNFWSAKKYSTQETRDDFVNHHQAIRWILDMDQKEEEKTFERVVLKDSRGRTASKSEVKVKGSRKKKDLTLEDTLNHLKEYDLKPKRKKT